MMCSAKRTGYVGNDARMLYPRRHKTHKADGRRLRGTTCSSYTTRAELVIRGAAMKRREFLTALAATPAAGKAALGQERSSGTPAKSAKPLTITLLGTGTP